MGSIGEDGKVVMCNETVGKGGECWEGREEGEGTNCGREWVRERMTGKRTGRETETKFESESRKDRRSWRAKIM